MIIFLPEVIMRRMPVSDRKYSMKVYCLRFFLVSILLICFYGLDAQTIHHIGADFSPSYVFPTNPFFKGTLTGKPVRESMSAHIKYGFQFGSSGNTGKMYPYAIQGIGVAYNTFFNNAEIGNPVALYVFQTSRIVTVAPGLSLDYEWNFGASFGWTPYDPEHNPMNIVVGSKANAYINLGFLLNWQITPGLNLRAGLGLSHFSNGNTGFPNAGVNTAGGRVGLTGSFGRFGPVRKIPENCFTGEDAGASCKFEIPKVTYDLILYGATRKRVLLWDDMDPYVTPGNFAIAGLNFNPLYNFNRYFRAGLSLDAQWDESANIQSHIAGEYTPYEDVRFYRPPFIEQFSLGLSARVEVVMPIFAINLGIGRNIICRGKDTDSFYQTFVLKTNVTRNIFLHVGYQLFRFREPNNLMLGIGYRFNTK